MGPKPSDIYPYKKRKRKRKERVRRCLKTGAEVGVKQPQAKERQKLEEYREDSSLEPSPRVYPYCQQHSEFPCLASRTAGEYISVLANHLVCANLLLEPQETKYRYHITIFKEEINF